MVSSPQTQLATKWNKAVRKKGSQLENSRFSFVPIKAIYLYEHLKGCQTTALLLTSAEAPSLFEREKPRKHGILFFLAFPGNPGIKEESRVPDQSQKVKAFLHLRKSLETSSVENCLLAFRAFPRIPGKPGEHGHSWIFPSFS